MALDKILVIGRDEYVHEMARPFTHQLFCADENDDIWEILHTVEPQAVIYDLNRPQEETCDFLTDIQEKASNIPVVLFSKKTDLPNEDQLRAMGAFDIILGENDYNRIGQIFDCIENDDLDNDRTMYFADSCPSCVSIVGKSTATQQTLKMIRLVAKSSCNPVLIVGETGTGKELAARAVHILRNGSNSKFVAINCAALTANLLESELFGHVKGSFTSADRDKTGLLELAEDGTVFLDEISEMPLDLQAKLLRVLQEKIFRKVGGTKDIKCKATLITSSNLNLAKEVKKGKFRSDLYYRLAICPINLSPLRTQTRKEDILLLADYFIKTSTICPEKTGTIKGMTKMAQQALLDYHWPGNVRELKNVIERAILLENSEKIGMSNLLIHPDQFYEEAESAHSAGLIKDFSLEKAEKELIAKALQEAGWQKTRAAALLGITRATLYAKVKQYNIQEPSKEKAVLSA